MRSTNYLRVNEGLGAYTSPTLPIGTLFLATRDD